MLCTHCKRPASRVCTVCRAPVCRDHEFHETHVSRENLMAIREVRDTGDEQGYWARRPDGSIYYHAYNTAIEDEDA